MREFLLNVLLEFDKHIIEFIKIPKELNSDENKESFKELSLISKEARKRKIFLAISGSWALVILLQKNFKHINDVDLIIKYSTLQSVNKLLLDLGYKKGPPKWSDTHLFHKGQTEVEFCNDKHIFSKIPLETKILSYQRETFTVATPQNLYQMYTMVFLRRKRKHKEDLVKLKMLKNLL